MNDTNHVTHAITREIPDTFADAVVLAAPPEPIRVDVARRQHLAYVEALESLGLSVTVLPDARGFPDCCFVEDCAVYADGVALITRPGTPSRMGEEVSIADALRPHARLEWMATPATLEGGDCLRVGRRWYVGRSERTNAAGVGCLREVFGRLGFDVVEVPVGRLLHLKCVCSYLGGGAMLLAERIVPPDVFRGVRVISIPANESYAAKLCCRQRHGPDAGRLPGHATRSRSCGAAGSGTGDLGNPKGGWLPDLSVPAALKMIRRPGQLSDWGTRPLRHHAASKHRRLSVPHLVPLGAGRKPA